MPENTTLRGFLRYAVLIAALLFLVAFMVECAYGQTLQDRLTPTFSGDVHAEARAWSTDDRCYQHDMEAGASIEALWGRWFAVGHLSMQWWGACDAKIPASFMNAESGRVIDRVHGAKAGVDLGAVRVGGAILRRSVHHFWRNAAATRTNQFPADNDAVAAKERCRSGGTCPGLGYYDALGPYIGVDAGPFSGEVAWLAYRWKALTLPWPSVLLEATYTMGPWEIGAEGQAGGEMEAALDASLYRRIFKRFWVGANVGRLSPPGWGKPIDRLAVGVRFH